MRLLWIGLFLLALGPAYAEDLLAVRGGVEVWSVPQPSPGEGFVATKIVLRTSDPGARIVTFEGLAFGGEFVQAWLPRLIGGPPLPTPVGPWPGSYPAEWAAFDSRVLIEPTMVGGGAGGSFTGIGETNDGSIGTVAGLPQFAGLDPAMGVGGISMASPTDAFFLASAFQSNELELAHLVVRSEAPQGGGFTMRLGVLGEGIENSGTPGGAQWGGDENPEPLVIPFSTGDGSATLPPDLLAVRGGVEVWSVPQPSPAVGYVATKIVLRTSDPSARIVTFEKLAFGGELVQVWLPLLGPSLPTPVGPWPESYPAEWAPFDSRVLIEATMVGGAAGAGHAGIGETNDESIGTVEGLPQFARLDPVMGVGGISMAGAGDAFFLVPEFQRNSVELAYLVARCEAAVGGAFTMSLGVLGEGIANSGEPGGAHWGAHDNPQPLPIRFPTGVGPATSPPVLLAERGGVEVWSVPQPSPGAGFVATKIVLRTTDPGAKLVTFEKLAFDGELVQAWLPNLLGGPPFPTPTGPLSAGYPPEWAPIDSRVLIEATMVGGGAGGGFEGIDETNDGSIGSVEGLPLFFGLSPVMGVGGISMASPTDAFFLASAFQSNEIELAHLVATSEAARGGGFTMSLGVLGEGIANSGVPGGAQWGADENPRPLVIAFPPEAGPEELPALAIRIVEGGMDLSFIGRAGSLYGLQYSADLTKWDTIALNLCGLVRFEDRDALRVARRAGFYRLVRQ